MKVWVIFHTPFLGEWQQMTADSNSGKLDNYNDTLHHSLAAMTEKP